MDYRDKCNAVHLLEMIVSRDAEILDEMMPEYACINVLIESIWNHGMYEVMSQIMQSRDEDKKAQEIPGFEGTLEALDGLTFCKKTERKSMDPYVEAWELYMRGWTPESVRDFHRSMCALHDWTEDECEAVATELEGIVG